MKKYARIFEGKVVELIETDSDISAMFHPDLVWAEITDLVPEVVVNMDANFSNEIWLFSSAPIINLSLNEIKEARLKEINSEFEKAMSTVVAGYPEKEISSWAKQETEARAYVANNATLTPLIDALSTARGLDKAELVGRIIFKADLFATISGQLIGKRQGLEDQLNALDETATAEDVEAVVW